MPLTLYTYLSLLASVILVIFGVAVLRSDKKSGLNRLFFIFIVGISVWLPSNYISGSVETNSGIALVFNHITLAAGIISVLALALLAKSLTLSDDSRWWRLLSALGLLSAFLALTPLVVSSIHAKEGVYEIVFGVMAPLYFVALFLLSVAAIYTLAVSRRRLKQADRARVDLILKGFTTTIAGLGVTNMFLPFVFNNFTLTNFGSYFIIFLAAAIGYAIAKHRLFDLRFVVVRLSGYIASFMLVGAILFLSLTVLSEKLGIARLSLQTQRIIFVGIAFLSAILYPPLKRLFDKTTNRLFYQDAYETQGLLDELNRVLVSTIELNKMLKASARVIEQNIKPEFCVFGLKETDFAEQRIIGEANREFNYEDIDYARRTTPLIDHKVIVTDHLDSKDRGLRSKMRKNDVAVLVRLTPDVETEGAGYIVLGVKKSGNPYSSQDIRVLETIANSMVIAIDNALRFEEIQQFNLTLQEKIERATKQLKHANDKLVTLNDTKDDFISMASHQLRTPLTAVKGNISMVLDGDYGKVTKQLKDPLRQAFNSSERMVGLIADLLNVSRLRTGKFAIQPVSSNLDAVVQSELDQLMETARSRDLKLTYDQPKGFPTLMLDEIKIRQVIMNFIDNAIYYTPPGGQITVTLKHSSKAIEFAVKDSGIGVPRDLQHHLFTKFYRASNAQKMRPDGTGIGLFMAKKVIVASGGSVVFKSVEGKGSTFGFTIPLAKLTDVQPVVVTDESTIQE